MAKQALYDYSKTPGSNTDIDGVDSTGTTGLVKSGDNYTRSMMSHARGFLDDLGGINTVAGTGDAITITLSSAPSALVDGMRLTFNASAANTTNVTLTVTPNGGASFGSKKVLKWAAGVETALSANDIPAANALIELIYDTARDTAAGAWMLLGTSVAAATTSASGIVQLATLTEAATLTNATKAVTPSDLTFLGGYTTTVTAAGTTTLTVTNNYHQFLTGTSTQTVVLPVTSTLVLGRSFRVVNNSTGLVTVQSSGANPILVLSAGCSAIFTCILVTGTTAASWDFEAFGIFVGTVAATTSGTTVDYTGIPVGVKRVVLNIAGMSTNGTNNIQLQIGDAGGIEASGYLGSGGFLFSTTAFGVINSTTGFMLANTPVAADVFHGSITLSLLDASTPTWVASGILGKSNTTALQIVAGSKDLSPGPLDRIRITGGGVDTFDAGKVNISFEF